MENMSRKMHIAKHEMDRTKLKSRNAQRKMQTQGRSMESEDTKCKLRNTKRKSNIAKHSDIGGNVGQWHAMGRQLNAGHWLPMEGLGGNVSQLETNWGKWAAGGNNGWGHLESNW